MNIDITDRAKLEKAICGALKTAIDAHGPITIESRASAAKRIYGLLKQISQQQNNTGSSNGRT